MADRTTEGAEVTDTTELPPHMTDTDRDIEAIRAAPPLSAQIMDIECERPEAAREWPNYGRGYSHGHQDARHASAKLAAEHVERIARLLAALEAATKDAERYRWLQSADNDVAALMRPNALGWQMLVGGRLDAAIDKAMACAATKTLDE